MCLLCCDSAQLRYPAPMKTKLLLALLGFAATVPCSGNADENDTQLGRYQAFVSSETRDKDDGAEDPGVWLLDTATGQIAFCRYSSGWVEVGKTDPVENDEEWRIVEKTGEPMVACTAWAVPKSGPWDKYQRQQQ